MLDPGLAVVERAFLEMYLRVRNRRLPSGDPSTLTREVLGFLRELDVAPEDPELREGPEWASKRLRFLG
jgi:hypothetical protein